MVLRTLNIIFLAQKIEQTKHIMSIVFEVKKTSCIRKKKIGINPIPSNE